MKSDRWLLFIEPEQPASALPVIDDPTRRMTTAFRRATPDRGPDPKKRRQWVDRRL